MEVRPRDRHSAALPHASAGARRTTPRCPTHIAAADLQAVHITGFQMHMSTMLMGLIFSGAPERYPNLEDRDRRWPASAGSPMCCSTWTSSGRTSFRTSTSR